MSLTIRPAIFREYDIRGIAGKDSDAPFAECLGQAYAQYISGRTPAQSRKRLTVSVGRDCRLTGEDYAESLIVGLRKGGLDVIRLGVCPTPLTYFSVFHLDLDGAIMVTGSHNPADYNGFKICVGKDTIHGHQIQELRALMEKNHPPASTPTKGQVSDYEIIPPYIDHVLKNSRINQPKKIVLDAGNGTATSTVAPELFEKLGATR